MPFQSMSDSNDPNDQDSLNDIKRWLRELRDTYSEIRTEADDILKRSDDEDE